MRRRLTIAQIRDHPWVAAAGYRPPEPMEEELPELTFADLPPLDLESGGSLEAFDSGGSLDGFLDDVPYEDDGFF